MAKCGNFVIHKSNIIMQSDYEQPIVSIITPIYNAEAFLQECLTALFAQSICTKIEYIFVLDAPTDSSANILEANAQEHQDLNITILKNNTNNGLAYSRALGMRAATGKYLMCCDADDWIDSDMAETLSGIALTSGADIVVSAMDMFDSNSHQTLHVDKTHFDNPNLLDNNVQNFSLCNKLILRTLIIDNSLYSSAGYNYWEDLIVTARAIMLSKKTTAVDVPLYHYRQSHGSMTSIGVATCQADHLYYAGLLLNWARDNGLADKFVEILNRILFTAKTKLLSGEIAHISQWKSSFTHTHRHIFKYGKQYAFCWKIALKLLSLLPKRVCISLAHLLGRDAD